MACCFPFVATGAWAGRLRHPNPVEEVRQSYLAGVDLGEDGAFHFVESLVQEQNPFVRRLPNGLGRAARGGSPPVFPFPPQCFLDPIVDSSISCPAWVLLPSVPTHSSIQSFLTGCPIFSLSVHPREPRSDD